MIKRLAIIIVLLSGCVAALTRGATQAQDDVVLPEPTGPYPVGQTEVYLVDDARPESFTEDPDDVRELLLTVFYPAAPATDAALAYYFPNETFRALAAGDFQPGFLDDFYAHSFLDAPLAVTDAGFPVIVYSSGLTVPVFLNTTLAEELASHGYIVIGIWHPYSIGLTVFPDGHMAEGIRAAQDQAVNQVAEVWYDDTAFVLGQLADLNIADSLLAGSMDLSHIGIFGWSVGGAVALTTLQHHDNVRAAVALDHTPFLVTNDGITQPVLLMRSTGNPLTPTFLDTVAQGHIIELRGSVHETYSDVPLLAPAFSARPPFLGVIDPLRASELINVYMLAFFDEHLKGAASPLLDEVPAEYEEVTFEVLGQ